MNKLNIEFKSAKYVNEDQTTICAVIPRYEYEGEEAIEVEQEYFVPVHEQNRFYQELQIWLETEDNEIASYVAPVIPEPEPETVQQRLERLTGLGIEDLRAALNNVS